MESNEDNRAPVWKISRHRLNTDGQGVTTLVVFWGCPLDCAYCVNPNTKLTNKGCECRQLTPEELYDTVRRDNLYFVHTRGGITFGGGEPLLRHGVIRRFARLCITDRWQLRIETSLNVPNIAVADVAEYINQWIVDIKDLSPTIYKAYTGKDNTPVIDNLRWLAANGYSDKVTIRLPHIEGYNATTDQQSSTAQLRAMGFTAIEEFDYLTLEQINRKNAHPNPHRGKSICKSMKMLRRRIAEHYGIPYLPHECTYDGPCLGTCPRCEKEVSILERCIADRTSIKPQLP